MVIVVLKRVNVLNEDVENEVSEFKRPARSHSQPAAFDRLQNWLVTIVIMLKPISCSLCHLGTCGHLSNGLD